MASIAIIGASGGIGSHIRQQALARGHQVTAITRTADLPAEEGLSQIRLDLADTPAVIRALAGHDAVISAYSPGLSRHSAEEAAALIAAAHESLFVAVEEAAVDRLILVGGVGSLQAEEGQPGDVVDADFYPRGHRAHTLQNREILRGLKAGRHDIDWTYVSPPLDIFEGPALGSYRLGGDVLLRDAEGKSRIARADFATAILDELDAGAHIRRRFTAAY